MMSDDETLDYEQTRKLLEHTTEGVVAMGAVLGGTSEMLEAMGLDGQAVNDFCLALGKRMEVATREKRGDAPFEDPAAMIAAGFLNGMIHGIILVGVGAVIEKLKVVMGDEETLH